MTDHLVSIKTLRLGKRGHLTYGKKWTELDGAYTRRQLGFLYFNDLFNDDATEGCGMCREDWESHLFLHQALKSTCFLKITIVRDSSCVHISPLRQEVKVRKLAGSVSQARGRTGFPSVSWFLEHLSLRHHRASSSLLGIQGSDFPIPNPEDLCHGKKKDCPKSPRLPGPHLREEEAAGRSKPLSHQVITGEGNKQA